ncbi:hypothetical protein QOZ84_01135 [Romboutsia sedimentorum]|uniref:Uncharacterized protein n=1 Tax=Romboutsia sedimentorum TaxID=1368474 RepID=A0ABT7E5F4_9FIRM|nr:hypothetical protein [Romboutsia sedimentorum]MDK2562136.1 hypothetical protein [Romboutsia sedimentorum]
MSDLLILLDKDIKRCEDVLKINNYLEIVIAVEELFDKYKGSIKDIGSDSDRVWNYSKKDLENIMDKLKLHRDKFIDDYNESRSISSINLKIMFNSTKNEIKNNNTLSKEKIQEVLDLLNSIEKINNEKISIDEKWAKLRLYMNILSKEDANIACKIINIINIILNN